MSLAYLVHRRQVSLMNASAAHCLEARHSHASLARIYADRIKDLVQLDRTSGLQPVSLA